MNDNLLYLFTILECIEKIKIYSKDFENAVDFYNANTQREYNATLNLLIAIGEESKKIDEELKSITSPSWNKIIGLRNILSHNYRGTEIDIIWQTIIGHLDNHKNDCTKIFKIIEKDKKEIEEILSTEFYRHIRYLLKEL